MNFKFKVNLTKQDYIDFNIFTAFKIPQGRQQAKGMRKTVTVIYCVAIILMLAGGIFVQMLTEKFVSGIILYILTALLIGGLIHYHLHFEESMARSLTKYVERTLEQGRAPYSAVSVVEFTDDGIMETDENSRTVLKYSIIEGIGIDTGAIYLHFDAVRAIILPFSCFESVEQREAFITYIEGKCPNINRYSE